MAIHKIIKEAFDHFFRINDADHAIPRRRMPKQEDTPFLKPLSKLIQIRIEGKIFLGVSQRKQRKRRIFTNSLETLRRKAWNVFKSLQIFKYCMFRIFLFKSFLFLFVNLTFTCTFIISKQDLFINNNLETQTYCFNFL